MKAEKEFIKKLEVYFDENFNDYTINRIETYLKEYRDSIPAIVIKEKEKITEEKNDLKIIFNSNSKVNMKKFIDIDILNKEATEFCDMKKISLESFITSKTSKGRISIITLRKEFCEKMHEKYLCKNITLAKFFNINHSTISFYMYGKTRSYTKKIK